MDLDELIARVDERVLGDEPLARVAAARDLCFELTDMGDQLVDHFVDRVVAFVRERPSA